MSDPPEQYFYPLRRSCSPVLWGPENETFSTEFGKDVLNDFGTKAESLFAHFPLLSFDFTGSREAPRQVVKMDRAHVILEYLKPRKQGPRMGESTIFGFKPFPNKRQKQLDLGFALALILEPLGAPFAENTDF